MWSGRELVSTIAWSLVETPPRERPRALLSIPLFRPTHPNVRGPQNRRRCCQLHRTQTGVLERFAATVRREPSWRIGCRSTSRVRIAPAGHAKERRFGLGKGRPRRGDGHPRATWDRSGSSGDVCAGAPIGRRSKHDEPQKALITISIAQQPSTITIAQPIEIAFGLPTQLGTAPSRAADGRRRSRRLHLSEVARSRLSKALVARSPLVARQVPRITTRHAGSTTMCLTVPTTPHATIRVRKLLAQPRVRAIRFRFLVVLVKDRG